MEGNAQKITGVLLLLLLLVFFVYLDFFCLYSSKNCSLKYRSKISGLIDGKVLSTKSWSRREVSEMTFLS